MDRYERRVRRRLGVMESEPFLGFSQGTTIGLVVPGEPIRRSANWRPLLMAVFPERFAVAVEDDVRWFDPDGVLGVNLVPDSIREPFVGTSLENDLGFSLLRVDLEMREKIEIQLKRPAAVGNVLLALMVEVDRHLGVVEVEGPVPEVGELERRLADVKIREEATRASNSFAIVDQHAKWLHEVNDLIFQIAAARREVMRNRARQT